ncbi:MAG: hypothetical protein NTV86_05965, partial [Planctomycetota bacterium]|nr:hypothetical protein [Planctomycetota bacterium]
DSMGGEAVVSLAAIEQAAAALPEALGAFDAAAREAQARAGGDTEAGKARKAALEEYLAHSAQRLTEAREAQAGLLAATKASVASAALGAALRGQTAKAGEEVAMAASLKALLGAMEDLHPDAEPAALTAKVADADVEAALQGAKNRVNNFDQAAKPFNEWIDQVEKLLAGQAALLREGRLLLASEAAGGGESLYRGFVGARLRYTAARYDAEARLNQTLATLCEVQVRRANLAADRHHARSEQFFYGMLGAQLAVIVATFAVAARKRSLVWSLAAIAGVFAVVFGLYVYLYV